MLEDTLKANKGLEYDESVKSLRQKKVGGCSSYDLDHVAGVWCA